ncbi:secretion system chaperone SscA [Pseudomonas sp. JAI115]|uniref:SycD/LcrH family type III secretion system chaperone n=1 Tax=Pseudomonas sp. JAI115 TaxID=2723061 RepID=UPI00161AFF4F|nr:SycD/LcrH family type III secretion system chaperone [Pseudomonas sp. JAI115]MBB6155178.1 secretion system chaperone SscA [Pseudomonas sp. JAI115]
MMQSVNPHAQDEQQVLQHFFARGGSLRMLADIQKEDIEQLYGYATHLFESGDIAAARNIYYMVSRIDQWHFDGWLALGLCNQRLGRHEEAVSCLARSGMIRVDDPRSAYFAAISHTLLGQVECARKALQSAILWCKGRTEHQAMLRSAEQMLRSAEQMLAECAQEGQP